MCQQPPQENKRRAAEICIRADGNEKIATGHLVRCLTIGAALKARGAAVCFLVADETSERLLRTFAAAYAPLAPDRIVVLHSRYDDLDGEIELLKKLLTEELSPLRPDFFLVDSYFATKRYLSFLQSRVPTGYLDDLLRFDPPVSLVVNYDVLVPEGFYSAPRILLLGPAYAPLRPQFARVPYLVRPRAARLLLSTGGSDPLGAALSLVRRFAVDSVLRAMEWDVVVGALHPDKKELRALTKRCPQLHLHENVSDMAALMRACDLAVTAGGTTLYELCAVGVPSVVYSMADNQVAEAEAFARAGVGFYEGDIRGAANAGSSGLPADDAGSVSAVPSRSVHDVYGRITARLRALADDLPLRQEQSARMRALVDGEGAGRIAEGVLDVCGEVKLL